MAAQDKEHDEYRAKEDARTLTEAESIHADGNRLAGAHQHLTHAKHALHRVLSKVNRRMSRAKSKK